ncbi:MAG: hypothetical protein WBM07_01505 [Chitinivibrionales bacterium]
MFWNNKPKKLREPITAPVPSKRDELDRAVRVMEILLMEVLNAQVRDLWDDDDLIDEAAEEIKGTWTRLKTLIRELTN